MENVVAFNSELSSLYDSKPPISKAKMASITKSAMRAIKFYKHVVQSVEKFILKCKPEYKVPGLYVIDSIVRQSRHQFGAEKDVFAPRFARNIRETFANLFRCAPEDKSRIIRVLNLWQKNNVFAPEVIQPIFDLADPNNPIYQLPPSISASTTSGGPSGSAAVGDLSANGMNTSAGVMDMNISGMSGSSGHGAGDDKLGNLPDLSNLSKEKAQNVLEQSTLRQLEQMQHFLKRQAASSGGIACTSSSLKTLSSSSMSSGAVAGCSHNVHPSTSTTRIHQPEIYEKYTKGVHELLKYDREHCREREKHDRHERESIIIDNASDHADDDDDSVELNTNSPRHTHASKKILDNNNLKQLLNDPNVIRQLQTLQSFQKFKQQEEKQLKMNEMRLQEEAFEKHLQNVLKASGSGGVVAPDTTDFSKEVEFVSEEQKIEVINLDGNDSRSPTPDRDRYKRRRSSRSRSRSRDRRDMGGRDRRGRRSRSRSRSRSPRSNRRRGSSRDRNNFSTRDKERDREHERERRKRGLPDIKKEHLSVCSTTLWVGHLSKLVYQEELSDTFGEFGDIVSIDQIVPRGCAFIVMNRRQDAYKAMQSLKNHKLQGRAITISWAAGKGVKSKEWKDFWDLELGVTYIPWNKLDDSTDLDSLEEGGMFDEDSMPGWMKDKMRHLKSLKEKSNDVTAAMQTANIPTPAGPGGMLFGIDTTQPPPGPPPSMMPMVGPGQFSMAPPAMGGPQRMLGPPMGMPGLPMPPNMVPGMPPPHPMMAPLGMMPNFRPIPGQVGAPPHMPLGPAGTQFPPPPVGAGPPANMTPLGVSNATTASSDDQMDIEMEDAEDVTPPVPALPTSVGSQLNFNQPPPLFGNNSIPPSSGNENGSVEPFTRDRNRNGNRWSGRVGTDNEVPGGELVGQTRWRDNGPGPNGMPNFNEGRGRGAGPMNAQPLDMNNPPQRPDFMNEFENPRGGPRGGGRGGFQNMPNRFNQPASLMQMRIPPPNSFNPRMGAGGPPMFMRGQGGPGNRPQGPGGFFNPRNPFDRDGPMLNMRGGGRGRGGRNNMPAGPPGSGNWSDDDMDDNFKRRGGGGGNRFRDRDGPDMGRGRRGGRATSRDRGGDFDRSRERGRDRNERSPDDRRRNSSREGSGPKTQNEKKSQRVDTEEDWDAELQEYDARNDPNKNPTDDTVKPVERIEESKAQAAQEEAVQPLNVVDNPFNQNTTDAPNSLYDELPAPAKSPVESAPVKRSTVVAITETAPQPAETAPPPAETVETTTSCEPTTTTAEANVSETPAAAEEKND